MSRLLSPYATVFTNGTAESLVAKTQGRGRGRGKTVVSRGQERSVTPEIVAAKHSEKFRGRGRGKRTFSVTQK